ncbi:MAG TPA: S8 family serine peptidase, partial [Methylomirabilota bacterium]|nr:S8 family serine peptidase [Methylomirabilota bacterium]
SPGEGPDLTAFQLVHLAPGADLAGALERFRGLPEVASADPIALMPVSALPSDSLAQATFWLYNPRNGRADIHAPEAWQVSMGDTSIVVGIIDTGVIPWHPDLGGRGERGNLWANWAERDGLPGVDDDGNGYVDDVAGWDFVQNGSLAAAGEDARNEDNDPNDWGGHGTAVAGIVGAIAGNDIGLAGVVPRARMMALRIGWLQQGDLPPAGTVDMAYAAAAIRYATRMGCAVVNCSWQSINSGGLDAAVTAATRSGMVVVNAAGNGGTPFTYLGQRDDVISVAGTDSTDVVWPGSVVGPWVDLSASGTGMVSTMFQRLALDSLGGRTPAYRGFLNGTSFAAPQVAGAVALMQAQRKALGEQPLTPAGVLLRLRETTDNIDAFQIPQVIGYGTGRLNMYRALADRPMSLAVRGSARSIGPAVILQYNTGRSLVVYAMSDRSLVAYDGAGGDTVWVRPLPALPVGNIAAVDTPLPLGPVIAVATAAGTVFLFHDDGTPVQGWPVTAQAGLSLTAGVSIADVDGDRVPDVAVGGSTISTARLWVWHLDGTLLAGFPFDAGVSGMSSLALGDVDAVAGAEIAYTDALGALHLVGFDGTERAGFPTGPASAARAPVMMRFNGPASPVVVIHASAGALTGYDADGNVRLSAALPGQPNQDPVIADLDGFAFDEIILSLSGPTSLFVFPALIPGWPRQTFAGPQGPLVVGPLVAGHGPCVMYMQSGGLVAFDEVADSVRAFPKPGNAGLFPSLADLDGDGATEIAAGTANADSNVYTYDAGAGTWSRALAQWPTPRGDMGRTASHAAGTPPPLVVDRIRPARVMDLVAFAHDSTTAYGSFTVSGDDSLVGIVALGELRRASFPLDELNFGSGILVSRGTMPPSGTNLSFVDSNLPKGSRWWYALRLVDDAGNASAVSNSDSVSLPGEPPAAIADLHVLAVTETTAVLTWSATGASGLAGRPDHYKVSGSTAPLDAANVDAAPLQLDAAAHQDAGGAETTLVARLTPGRRWRFAVRGVDDGGAVGAISNIAEAVTPVGGALTGHSGMAVACRPQPAATSVNIDWQGDDSGAVSQWLVVYDLTGRERRRIALGTEPGGSYNWDGRDGESRLLPAGLYFIRLVSGARHAGSRVVFVR